MPDYLEYFNVWKDIDITAGYQQEWRAPAQAPSVADILSGVFLRGLHRSDDDFCPRIVLIVQDPAAIVPSYDF